MAPIKTLDKQSVCRLKPNQKLYDRVKKIKADTRKSKLVFYRNIRRMKPLFCRMFGSNAQKSLSLRDRRAGRPCNRGP